MDQPTNLHTHGLHLSPVGNSDNVFLHLMPRETFQFEFQIPGFFWRQPNLHGYTRAQVDAGMAGALIVEGGLDDLSGSPDCPSGCCGCNRQPTTPMAR